jgi:DNA polymerase III alpha subunit (gram-positive type)
MQLGKDILPHCDQTTQEHVTNRLCEAYKKLIRAGIVYNKCNTIVKEAAEEIEVDNDANQASILKACDSIETISRDRVNAFNARISDEQICRDRLYVDLMETLKEARETSSLHSAFDPQPDEMDTDEDGSGEETEVDVDDEATLAIPTKDPLTKKDIKNPVKNKHCGHVYDEKPILNYMKTHQNKAKCPYAGCTNSNILKKDHLESDEQLTKKVAKKQKGQRRRRRR